MRSPAVVADDPRQRLGKSGEDLACAELVRRGYAILERRYRTRFGEIDIVARDGPTTVFVEVKTRRGGDYGGGAEAVTPWKQRRIAGMAVDFIARQELHDQPCRFDVVTVDETPGGPRVEVFVNAFDSPY
jgi:putative endonuclease